MRGELRALPIETLMELLRLDVETGKLFWRERDRRWFPTHRAWAIWNGRYAGHEAFTATNPDGYRVGSIFHRLYLAHRVIFAMHHGRWPVGGLDHHKAPKSNNRPGNLREATDQQNNRNIGSKRGVSRFCGVGKTYGRNVKPWRARCADHTGRQRQLGTFHDELDAARAYDRAAREWHGEFANLNFPEEISQ